MSEILPGELPLALAVQVAFEPKQEVPVAGTVVAETPGEALAIFRIIELAGNIGPPAGGMSSREAGTTQCWR